MAFKYLSNTVLSGFDKYKYCSVDTSPVSKYVTHPFWNWLVEFVPKSIAPNTLTLSGFMLLVLQFGLFSYYDFHFYASDLRHPEYPPVPNWVFMVAAFCMFWAHTLDGIDGKQARRTGTSSPLGELFDHGLDSWATLFMPVGLYSIFGREVSVGRVYWILIGVMFTFACSHWEKHNTGTLFLPWGYDVSQLGMTLLYIVAYVFGYTFYKTTLPFTNLDLANVFEFVMHASVFAFSLPMCIYNIWKAVKNGTHKRHTLHEAMYPLYPVFLHHALFLTWMYYSSVDVVRQQPRLFYLASGTVFSNITCRMIVNSMSNTRCQMFNWLLIPLLVIVSGVLTIHLGQMEVYLLYAYTMFTLAAHIHYGICVVQQLADHFEILPFSTEKKPKKANE